jgi:hypothetical protein
MRAFVFALVLNSVAGVTAGTAISGNSAVQLCRCDPASAASQQWTWGNRNADRSTTAAPLHLKSDPSQCMYVGLSPEHPTYVYVANCSADAPQFSFVPTMKPGLERDLQVLVSGAGKNRKCLDADGMSANLQLYNCIEGDNDQQYAAIDGVGLVVDLWTGFSNCMGAVGDGCLAPRGTHPIPPPPAPQPAGVPSNWLSPRYHLNDGSHRMSDPSGCLEINGSWVVFPDGSSSEGGKSGAYFQSTDLVHWTRHASNIRFTETGGIALREDLKAVTFGSGWHITTEPVSSSSSNSNSSSAGPQRPSLQPLHSLSEWTGWGLGAADPHVVARNGEEPATKSDDRLSGLFRVLHTRPCSCSRCLCSR